MFQKRLEFKILTLIISTMIIGFGLLILFLIHKQTNSLIEQRKERARVLSTTIKKSITNAMLNGRPDIIRQIMNELKTVKGIDQLNILRTDGTEAFRDTETLERLKSLTTLSREVIEAIEKSEGKSLMRADNKYFKEVLKEKTTVEYFEKENGRVVLTHLEPLMNVKKCQVCHGTANKINGIIRISSRMDDAFYEIRRNRRNAILASLGVIVLISIALKLLMESIIIKSSKYRLF